MRNPVDLLRRLVSETLDVHILLEHGDREALTHPLNAMISTKACEKVEETVKLSSDSEGTRSEEHDKEIFSVDVLS